jgi:hypothetical protein
MTRNEAIELIDKYGNPRAKRCCRHRYNDYAVGHFLKRHKVNGNCLSVCQICGSMSYFSQWDHPGAGCEIRTLDIPSELRAQYAVENKLLTAYNLLMSGSELNG